MENQLQNLWDKQNKGGYPIVTDLPTINQRSYPPFENRQIFIDSFTTGASYEPWSLLYNGMPELFNVLNKDSKSKKGSKIHPVSTLEQADAFDIGNVFVKTKNGPSREYTMVGPIDDKFDLSSTKPLPEIPKKVQCAKEIRYEFRSKRKLSGITVEFSLQNITKRVHPEGKAYENIILTDFKGWDALNKHGLGGEEGALKLAEANQRYKNNTDAKHLDFNLSCYIIHCVYYADVILQGNFPLSTDFYNNWVRVEYKDIPIFFSFVKFDVKKEGLIYERTRLAQAAYNTFSGRTPAFENTQWWLIPGFDTNVKREITEFANESDRSVELRRIQQGTKNASLATTQGVGLNDKTIIQPTNPIEPKKKDDGCFSCCNIL